MALVFKRGLFLQERLNLLLSTLPGKGGVALSVGEIVGDEVSYAEHRGDAFLYGASLPKLFVVLALFIKVEAGGLNLTDEVAAVAPNVRDLDLDKGLITDLRPALEVDHTYTVACLLDLVITRSDDTAANILIDLLTREYINEVVCEYGWAGSEVTRKFIKRHEEEPQYREVDATVTCTNHLVEYMALVATHALVNRGVSRTLKLLLNRQRDHTKLTRGLLGGLPRKQFTFAHKTAWCGGPGDPKFIWTTGDCGIIEMDDRRFVVACIINEYGQNGRRIARYIGRHLLHLF